VDLSTMTGWLQAVVGRNPVTYLATASRGLMHGRAAWTDLAWVLVASAAIVLVASAIAMRMYRKEAVTRVRARLAILDSEWSC
jgi:ABC-2 type transport system permease protein